VRWHSGNKYEVIIILESSLDSLLRIVVCRVSCVVCRVVLSNKLGGRNVCMNECIATVAAVATTSAGCTVDEV